MSGTILSLTYDTKGIGSMSKLTDFPITNQAMKTIESVMKEQDIYGFDKYKKPLDHTDNYNWMEMFLQEMADGLKYIQCEMVS